MKLADAHKIHPLSFIAVAFIVTTEWSVGKIMPKYKKNRKIKCRSEKYENVMRKNEARCVFGILKWLVGLWKGFETETKKLEK